MSYPMIDTLKAILARIDADLMALGRKLSPKLEEPAPPVGGITAVHCDAKHRITMALDAQYRKGMAEYGRPLMTFDGRDSGTDLLLEQADTIVYGVKLANERRTLECLLRRAVHILDEYILVGHVEDDDQVVKLLEDVERCTDIELFPSELID